LASAMWILSADIVLSQTQTPQQMARTTSEGRFPLTRAYQTRDGRFIQFMFLDPERHWVALCRNIGSEHLLTDPRFSSAERRVEHGAALANAIAAAIAQRDWEQWRPIFEGWDAPWELVKTIHEVAADPQAAANGYVFDVEVTDGTRVRLASGPVGFDGMSAPITPRRAPQLGEHTEQLLAALGYNRDEIERLRCEAAIQ
jgi:crotonobetainyl-CoA:carnitine CoA-transferase CaiB-like acyl-CoA transferase